MDKDILDLNTDYLISSFGQTPATGLAKLMDGAISHDQVSRMLASPKMTSKDWWQMVKPQVRKIEQADGLMIIDDSIEEKPYTDENEIICWHYDHSKGCSVKGINFITTLYYARRVALLLAFEIVSKTEKHIDKKTGKAKRKSKTTRNEYARQMLLLCSWFLRVQMLLNLTSDVEEMRTGFEATALKIGWKWVLRAFVKGFDLITQLMLFPLPDPEPAKASNK